jgi:hypothetical protein
MRSPPVRPPNRRCRTRPRLSMRRPATLPPLPPAKRCNRKPHSFRRNPRPSQSSTFCRPRIHADRRYAGNRTHRQALPPNQRNDRTNAGRFSRAIAARAIAINAKAVPTNRGSHARAAINASRATSNRVVTIGSSSRARINLSRIARHVQIPRRNQADSLAG